MIGNDLIKCILLIEAFLQMLNDQENDLSKNTNMIIWAPEPQRV